MSKYIYLSGSIGTGGPLWGEISTADVRAKIDAIRAEDASAPITVVLNSYGGDVTEGIAIYNLLQATGVDVVISGMAASIASVIAMAGKKVSMYDNSTLFVHHAWTWGEGNAADFEQRTEELKAADKVLVDAYVRKSGRTEDEIRELLDGPNGDGSSIDAARALELGLIDEILDPTQAVAAMLKRHSQNSKPRNTTHNKEEEHTMPDTTTTTPVAECGEPKQTAEETVEIENEVETTDDPAETRITELEKKVEELTNKLAEKDKALAAAAKFRSVNASAPQVAEDAALSWPEAVKKYGFAQAAEKFPQLRADHIAAECRKGSLR